jgi:hypothetical protein
VDLSQLKWRKSSYSGPDSPQCVEVAERGLKAIAIRDSKDANGGVLLLTRPEWRAFLTYVKGNAFGA